MATKFGLTSILVLLVSSLLADLQVSGQQADVYMPAQMQDGEDPCQRRYPVQEGETCNSVARRNQISVDDLLFLNPGMKCSPFFSDVNLCVDIQSSGRMMDDAQQDPDFQLMSTEELQFNNQNADTPAVIPDAVDTGYGKKR